MILRSSATSYTLYRDTIILVIQRSEHFLEILKCMYSAGQTYTLEVRFHAYFGQQNTLEVRFHAHFGQQNTLEVRFHARIYGYKHFRIPIYRVTLLF